MANADLRKDEASQLAPNQVKLPCQDAQITETEPRIVARLPALPIQAITADFLLNKYTITVCGPILSLDAKLRNQTVIYKAGSNTADDPLLNPARLLVGKEAPHPNVASDFANWVVGSRGQAVITGFKKAGQQLYNPAPPTNSTA